MASIKNRCRLFFVATSLVLCLLVAIFQRGALAKGDEGADSNKDYTDYKLGKLKRLLFYRGIECDHCDSKAEWVELMTQNAHLEEVPDLKEEYDRLKEFKKNAERHNTTKEEFLKSIKTNMTETLEESVEDSVWKYFQQQMHDGSVQFQEDGSASFMLPMSFHLAPYLYPSVASAIDGAQFGGRRLYFQLPRLWRMKLERNIDSQVITMVLGTTVVGLLIILIFDCVKESMSKGDKDGDEDGDDAADSSKEQKGENEQESEKKD